MVVVGEDKDDVLSCRQSRAIPVVQKKKATWQLPIMVSGNGEAVSHSGDEGHGDGEIGHRWESEIPNKRE